jgi:hypothetical protein
VAEPRLLAVEPARAAVAAKPPALVGKPAVLGAIRVRVERMPAARSEPPAKVAAKQSEPEALPGVK